MCLMDTTQRLHAFYSGVQREESSIYLDDTEVSVMLNKVTRHPYIPEKFYSRIIKVPLKSTTFLAFKK